MKHSTAFAKGTRTGSIWLGNPVESRNACGSRVSWIFRPPKKESNAPGNREERAMSHGNVQHDGPGSTSRRGMLRQTAGAAVLGVTALGSQTRAQDSPSSERAVKNGRIKQSIVYWCFEKDWDMDQAAKVANQLGCESIELIAAQVFPGPQAVRPEMRDRHDRHEPRPAVRQGIQ